jgi:hypothetical protein
MKLSRRTSRRRQAPHGPAAGSVIGAAHFGDAASIRIMISA